MIRDKGERLFEAFHSYEIDFITIRIFLFTLEEFFPFNINQHARCSMEKVDLSICRQVFSPSFLAPSSSKGRPSLVKHPLFRWIKNCYL